MVVGRGHAVLVRTGGRAPHAVGRRVVGVRSRDGGGAKGKGKDPNRVYAAFAGATHVLAFETAGEGDTAVPLGMFVSERCSDGDMVVGRAVEREDGER